MSQIQNETIEIKLDAPNAIVEMTEAEEGAARGFFEDLKSDEVLLINTCVEIAWLQRDHKAMPINDATEFDRRVRYWNSLSSERKVAIKQMFFRIMNNCATSLALLGYRVDVSEESDPDKSATSAIKIPKLVLATTLPQVLDTKTLVNEGNGDG